MKREHAFAAVFLVLAAALVAGQRFGFRFAGGPGYEPPLQATADGAVFARGTMVRTDANRLTLNLAGLGEVDFQPHTELTIERLAKNEVILRLGAGEITVTAGALPVEIRMDVVEATVQNGFATFQHAPERRLVRIYPGQDAVRAGRRSEEKTPVTEPSVLFYDRTDRETIDDLPKKP